MRFTLLKLVNHFGLYRKFKWFLKDESQEKSVTGLGGLVVHTMISLFKTLKEVYIYLVLKDFWLEETNQKVRNKAG